MKYPVPSNCWGAIHPSISGTDAGFGYVDTPIRYQDANTHGSEAKAQLVRSLSYLFQHDPRLSWLGWEGILEGEGQYSINSTQMIAFR